MIVTEPWRHHCSGQIFRIPHNRLKYPKTHITVNWRLEIPDHVNNQKWEDQAIRLKISTLRRNIINIYGLIWVQCSPALQSKLKGDPEYIIKSSTYNLLWLYTKFKMCTSGIVHTSNGYHSAVMDMRTIFCPIQGIDKPKEAYYRIFEASISTADLVKCNATTHMELNKSYANGDDKDGTNRFQ